MASPYDALLDEPAPSPSPYDALLQDAPAASPYDALLTDDPAPSKVSGDASSPVTNTPAGSMDNAGNPAGPGDAVNVLTSAESERAAALGRRKFVKAEADANPLTPAEDAELRALNGKSLRGTLKGSFLDQTPESLTGLDVAGVARAGIDAQAASSIAPGNISLQPLIDAVKIHPSTIQRVDPKYPQTPNSQEDQPIVTFPTPTGDSVGAGIVRGAANVASGLTTPVNLALAATMGGAPAALQRTAAVGFAAQMGAHVPESIQGVIDAQTPGEKAQKTTEAISEIILAGLAAKHGFGRPGEGGLSKGATRPASLTPDQADTAAQRNATRAGLDALTPDAVPLTKDTQPITPETLDGLHLAREKLEQRLRQSPEDQRAPLQSSIDDIDAQLLAADKGAAQASAARVRGRDQSPPPEGGAGQPITTGGPSGEGGTSALFQQLKGATDTLKATAATAAPQLPAASEQATLLAAEIERIGNERQAAAEQAATKAAATVPKELSTPSAESQSQEPVPATAKESAPAPDATKPIDLSGVPEWKRPYAEEQLKKLSERAKEHASPVTIAAFHGTPESTAIKDFGISKPGSRTKLWDSEAGIFLTSSKDLAEAAYTPKGGSVGEYTVNLKKPYRTDKAIVADMLSEDFQDVPVAQVRAAMQSHGYDGIVTKDGGEIVAFDPKSISTPEKPASSQESSVSAPASPEPDSPAKTVRDHIEQTLTPDPEGTVTIRGKTYDAQEIEHAKSDLLDDTEADLMRSEERRDSVMGDLKDELDAAEHEAKLSKDELAAVNEKLKSTDLSEDEKGDLRGLREAHAEEIAGHDGEARKLRAKIAVRQKRVDAHQAEMDAHSQRYDELKAAEVSDIVPARPVVAKSAPTEAAIAEPSATAEIPPVEPPTGDAEAPKGGDDTTSLKRAVVDEERAARGAEEIPTPERTPDEQAVESAREALRKDPTAAKSIVSRILDEGTPSITREDAAMLLAERRRIMNERAGWEDRLGRGENVDTAKARLSEIETELDRLDRAQRAAGSEWSAIGRMYQREIAADYTLEAIERKARAAKQGPLTDEERGKIKEQAAEIERLKKVEEEARKLRTEAAEDAEVKRVLTATVEELRKSAAQAPKVAPRIIALAESIVTRLDTAADAARKRIRERLSKASAGVDPTVIYDVAVIGASKLGRAALDFAKWAVEMKSDLGDWVEPHLEDAWKQSNAILEKEEARISKPDRESVKKVRVKKGEATPMDVAVRAKAEAVAGEPLSHATVYELARAYINAGVHGEVPVMKAVHETLQGVYPDLTERDVRRAMSQYGEVKFPSKEAISQELSEIRTLTRLQESIDRMTEGRDALHTGLQRDKATQSIREKQKTLNELLKKHQGPPSPEKLASREEAKQTALRNAIADLDKQLRTGEKTASGKPAPDSPGTEQLKAERAAMKAKLKEIEDEANPGKSEEQRALDAMEKRRDALLERLNSGDLSTPGKKAGPLTSEQADVQAQIDTINSQIAELRKATRDSANPPKNAAEKQVEQLSKIKERLDDTLSGKRPENAPKDWTPLSASAEDMMAEIQAMRELAAQAKRDAKPPGDPGAKAEQYRIRVLEKAIERYEQRLAAGDFSTQGKVQGPDSPEVAALKAILDARIDVYNAAKRAGRPVRSPEEIYNATRLKAVLKRTAEMQAKIDAKDFTRTPKRVPPVKDDAVKTAEIELAKKKLEVDQGIERERLKNRTAPQKFWDHFVGIERAMKLSSDVVLAKLSAAAVVREAILTPMEEVIGGAVSNVLPRLAARAPREGGFSMAAEIKAKQEAFTSGMADAWKNLHMKRSDLETLYGKKKDLAPPSWYEYLGFLHGALKAPVKRAEFARSLQKRMEFAAKDGLNLNDRDTMLRLSEESYLDANRSIFMQDNVVAQTFSSALRIAENSKIAPKLGPGLARLGRFLVPIVKVPTNIVGEVATGIHGTATGGARAAKAYIKGIESLPPDQADAIMRQLKKGLVGNALLLTGYLGYNAIGGFHHEKDKRRTSDVEPEHYRIGSVDLPPVVGHSTGFMLLNVGATIRRVQEERESLGKGAAVAGAGVVKQLPFIPAATGIVNALESERGFEKYIDGMITSTAIPSLVQHAAKVKDTPGSFPKNAFTPANRREVNGPVDALKVGVPGLRETLRQQSSKSRSRH